MNQIIKSMTGLASMSDQVIATDFLTSAKAGIRNYSIALTETTSPELRTTLKSQLNDAINTHERITDYMLKKGYYYAYDLHDQYDLDMKTTETALELTDTL